MHKAWQNSTGFFFSGFHGDMGQISYFYRLTFITWGLSKKFKKSQYKMDQFQKPGSRFLGNINFVKTESRRDESMVEKRANKV